MAANKKAKLYFDPVDPKVNFSQMEEKLLKDWYEKGIVKKYLSKNKNSKKYFSFLDGPITANNPMGVHHAWGRTYKDLWQRYKNMQGYRQRFQNGFDCQGLWVEVEVEKELGFKNKKDIENYGVDKFVKKCKERVFKYADIQTRQSKRLGYFMDWDNSYFTLSDTNNYMIWKFLKVCHENGWLYRGAESVPWCPRCETAISQHEMLTEDYKEVVHDSIYCKLPIIGRSKEFLLIWTTTPWTIPANIAVAVDNNLEYSLVEGDTKNKYWIARQAIKRVFGNNCRVVKTVKGEKLVGLKYKSPFDNLPAVKKVEKENGDKLHIVVATDLRILPISTNEGTGLVHTAVSAGTEDFRLGKKLGLPMIPVIADNADYLKGLGFLSGKNAKKHPEVILDYLKKEDKKEGVDWVFKIERYKHRYPGCWRCKTELVWKITEEWYIAMDKPSKSKVKGQRSEGTLRQRMVEVAKTIKWLPSFGLDRELDWLSNMHDWLISKKNRYWGLALPIWECKSCGYFDVIGSSEELKEKAFSGWDKFKGKSPHKPYIDEVKLKCGKCAKEISRIEPVGNPWLDAGIVAYSTISSDNKSANPKYEEKPLYLTNKLEWKKWFPANFITESFPGQFKNWFYSLIAMSTVLEDRKPFEKVLGFGTLLAENGKPMHKSWGNAIEFNKGAEKIGVDVMRWMYAKQDPAQNLLFGYNVADQVRRSFHLTLWNVYNFFVTYANIDGFLGIKQYNTENILDVWINARLFNTIIQVTKSLDIYDAKTGAESINDLVSDLSLWYVRRSRNRIGPSILNKKDKDNCYSTLWILLINLSKLIAPFTPFIADIMYTNLTKSPSVHLESWWDDKDLDVFRKIKDQRAKVIQDMKLVRKVVEKGHSERKISEIPVRQPLNKITVIHSNEPLVGDYLKLIKDELNVKSVVWKVNKEAKVPKVTIDTKITPQLKEEGKVRELIRKIQDERKNQNFGLKEKAVVSSDWLPENKKLTEHLKTITLTSKLQKGKFKVEKAS